MFLLSQIGKDRGPQENRHVEILERVRRLEVATRKQVESNLAGSYHTMFHGHGMQFSEFREYVHGDDIRHISWTVSARTKKPVVKRFEEERELNVLLVMDVSASELFSTNGPTKRQVLAEAAAMVAFAAMKNQDRVGALFFTDKVESFIPPKKGRTHVMRIIRDLLFFEPEGTGTDIHQALMSTSNILKGRSVVILASDFLTNQPYSEALSRLSRKHDVIAIQGHDPRESTLPSAGLIQLRDPETGRQILLNTSDGKIRQHWEDQAKIRQKNIQDGLLKSGVEHLPISTQDDHFEKIMLFFSRRGRKGRMSP